MRRAEPSYSASVAASLAAEAVFIAMVAGVALARGKDPWMVARVPASFLLGPAAVRPKGFVVGDVLIGLSVHLWLAVLVGVVYAALRPRLGIPPVLAGLITGAVLYGIGFWLLPQLFPTWLAPFWLPPTGRALQAAAHTVYGVVLGLNYRHLLEMNAGSSGSHGASV